ncbi:MAG: hypothetical protein KA988_05480 [Longilinea sp.]|nr:hypothetical protein [Longilinea sp.]
MRSPFATAIAISVGLILLIGYFLPIGLLGQLPQILLNWGVSLAGVAGLVAILNLVGVHWRKARAPRDRDGYSPLFIVAFLLTFVAGLVLGPTHPVYQRVVTSIQVPIEASLMGVVAISLTYASIRLFQRRSGMMPYVFVISTIVFLLILSGLLSIGGNLPLIGGLVSFINRLPLAGARGILLGVALGSLTAGLRILMAADRPYSG